MMVQKKSMFFKIIAVLFAVFISVFGLFSQKIFAQDEKNKQITLICANEKEGVVLSGMTWNLYKVGSRGEGDTYTLEGDFEKYPVEIKDFQASTIETAAKTLESYAIADKINPLATEITDGSGKAVFKSLDKGLYLALGTKIKIGSTTYIPSAILVEVSDKNASLNYDAYPKYSENVSQETSVKYELEKFWKGDSEDVRPKEIEVEIYKNNELNDTIKLNSENNWYYSWESGPDSVWKVVEKNVPNNYTVKVDSDKLQFVIENTYHPVTTPAQTSLTNKTTGTVLTEVTTQNVPQTPNVTTMPKTTAAPKLPQTGQLWWPCLAFAIIGIVLLAVGFILKKRAGDAEDEK